MLLIPLVSRQSVRALFCSWCVVSQIIVIIVEDNLCLDLEICLALLYLIWLIVNRPLTVLTILLPHVRLCLIDYLAFDHLYWINDNDFGISLVLRLAPLVTVTSTFLMSLHQLPVGCSSTLFTPAAWPSGVFIGQRATDPSRHLRVPWCLPG